MYTPSGSAQASQDYFFVHPQLPGHLLEVGGLLHRVGYAAQDGGQLPDRLGLGLGRVQGAVKDAVDDKGDQGPGAFEERLKSGQAFLPDEIVRVLALGQDQNPGPDLLPVEDILSPGGRPEAGFVGIVD